jgi:hypothetical protein
MATPSEFKANVTPNELSSIWRMMIRSRDFSFSTSRLNNLVDTLVKLKEIRPEVATEAKAIAMYGGEIMSGRGSLERTVDVPPGSEYEDVLGSKTDLRYYTGENAGGLRASEQGVNPARNRLRFSSDMDPEVLRVLQKSLKTNEGKRLFRLVRTEAIESGLIPPSKTTRASVMREIKSIYKAREFQPKSRRGPKVLADLAKARAEERAMGSTASPTYSQRDVNWKGRSVSYGSRRARSEQFSRGADIVGETLGMSGAESPEERARFEEARLQRRLAREKVFVPLEGGRAAKQKDDPAFERQIDQRVRATQKALSNLLRMKKRLIESGKLSPRQIKEFNRRESELRAFLQKPPGTASNTIDVAVRKANNLVERLKTSGVSAIRRLRAIARKNSPEFKAELARIQARYERDVQLRRKAKSQAREGRRQPKFRTVDTEVRVYPDPRRMRPPVNQPVDPDTLRRQEEQARYGRAANEEVRRLGGVSGAVRSGRLIWPKAEGERARLLAELSPEVLRWPPASQFPPGRAVERRPTPRLRLTALGVKKGFPDLPGSGQQIREYLAKMAEQDASYAEYLKRLDEYLDKVEREGAARARAQAEARFRPEPEALQKARERKARERKGEEKAKATSAVRTRRLIRGNPISILRYLASRGIPIRPMR